VGTAQARGAAQGKTTTGQNNKAKPNEGPHTDGPAEQDCSDERRSLFFLPEPSHRHACSVLSLCSLNLNRVFE
jgi:hypothetical protein